MIHLSPPHMNGEEIQYIKDAVDSNWVAPTGPHVIAFEQELAEKLKVNEAVLVSSGTAAIHLGLIALGVGKGDEVICPTLTFCATANPIIYCGARPVFVDSEPESWNVSPSLLEEAIHDRIKKTGRKPRAIIVVHLYGMPANISEIKRIADLSQIPVLEDAAESLGSHVGQIPTGTFGEAGILSFNGNKIITTGGGGAVITNNPRIAERARFLRQEAKLPLPYYQHEEIGYNYRLSNISAAIGRAQLLTLDERVIRRKRNFEIYESILMPSGVTFQPEPEGYNSNRWLSVIVLPKHSIKPLALKQALERSLIETRLAWKPMHLQPVFKDSASYGGNFSESLFNQGLCLPSGSSLTDDLVQGIALKIKQYLEQGI